MERPMMTMFIGTPPASASARYSSSRGHLLRRASAFDYALHQFRAMGIRVLSKNSLVNRRADRPGATGRQAIQELDNFPAFSRDEDFLIRLKERVDADPIIRDQTNGGAGR